MVSAVASMSMPTVMYVQMSARLRGVFIAAKLVVMATAGAGRVCFLDDGDRLRTEAQLLI